MYDIATRANSARPIVVAEKNFTTDVDGILAAVTPRTKLVFIANPNNPTGRLVPPADLAAAAERLARTDGLLVVAEAFVDVLPAGASVDPDLPLATVVLPLSLIHI